MAQHSLLRAVQAALRPVPFTEADDEQNEQLHGFGTDSHGVRQRVVTCSGSVSPGVRGRPRTAPDAQTPPQRVLQVPGIIIGQKRENARTHRGPVPRDRGMRAPNGEPAGPVDAEQVRTVGSRLTRVALFTQVVFKRLVNTVYH